MGHCNAGVVECLKPRRLYLEGEAGFAIALIALQLSLNTIWMEASTSLEGGLPDRKIQSKYVERFIDPDCGVVRYEAERGEHPTPIGFHPELLTSPAARSQTVAEMARRPARHLGR